MASRRGFREDQRRAALPLARGRPRRRGSGKLCDQGPGQESRIEIPQESNAQARSPRCDRHGSASILSSCTEGDWRSKATGNGPLAQQSSRELASTISKARASNAPLQAHTNVIEVRLSPRLSSHPFQFRASPLLPCQLQTEPRRCSRRVAAALFRIGSRIFRQTETSSNLSDTTATLPSIFRCPAGLAAD